MQKRILTIMALVILTALVVPTVADAAFIWRHVGGDPLVPGGVWSQDEFGYKMLNSSKVRRALKLVRKANGQPSWVLPAAYKKVEAGHIHYAKIKPGTKVGAMSYGRNKVRVVKKTTYAGERKLGYYYVNASKTTRVTRNGHKYLKKVTYRVGMVRRCGNGIITHKRVTYTRLYSVKVEKREGWSGGRRLGGWEIHGKIGSDSLSRTTRSDKKVLVGYFPAGTKYNLAEIQRDGWEVVYPEGGRWEGKTPARNLTLRFVNRRVVPEPTLYRLYVEKREGSVTGPRLANWRVRGTVGGTAADFLTRSDGAILVGYYPAGTSYNLAETLQPGWEVVSPTGGRWTGTMPARVLVLRFVNRRATTGSHSLAVVGTEEMVEHIDQDHWRGYLTATITSHSDGDDIVSYRWNINGTNYTTGLARYPVVLEYDTVYLVTVTVTDALGHTASYSLPAFNHIGPADEPTP